MRQQRTYGSVRGAVSNGRPYRDQLILYSYFAGGESWPLARFKRLGCLESQSAGRIGRPTSDRIRVKL